MRKSLACWAIFCMILVTVLFVANLYSRPLSPAEKGFVQISNYDAHRLIVLAEYAKRFEEVKRELATKYKVNGCDVFGTEKEPVVECVK